MRGKLRNRFLKLLAQKEMREDRRIGTSEIAGALGVSQPAVLRWIRNEITKYEEPMLRAICDYFDCDIGDLLYFEDVDDAKSDSAAS